MSFFGASPTLPNGDRPAAARGHRRAAPLAADGWQARRGGSSSRTADRAELQLRSYRAVIAAYEAAKAKAPRKTKADNGDARDAFLRAAVNEELTRQSALRACVESLKYSGLFSECAAADLVELAAGTALVEYGAGEVILRQGQVLTHLLACLLACLLTYFLTYLLTY